MILAAVWNWIQLQVESNKKLRQWLTLGLHTRGQHPGTDQSSSVDECEHKRAVLEEKAVSGCTVPEYSVTLRMRCGSNRARVRMNPVQTTEVRGSNNQNMVVVVVAGVCKVKNNMLQHVVDWCRDALNHSKCKQVVQWFLLLVFWQFVNQLGADRHLVYQTVYSICKRVQEQNGITNVNCGRWLTHTRSELHAGGSVSRSSKASLHHSCLIMSS